MVVKQDVYSVLYSRKGGQSRLADEISMGLIQIRVFSTVIQACMTEKCPCKEAF
jgi:hypothetical protein